MSKPPSKNSKGEVSIANTDAIYALAVDVMRVGKEKWLLKLAVEEDFSTALDAYLVSGECPDGLKDLTDDERTFCEGWAYLAASYLKGADKKHTAANIRRAINDHVKHKDDENNALSG